MLYFARNLFQLLTNRIDDLISRCDGVKSSLVVFIVIANCFFFKPTTEASTFRFDFNASNFNSIYYGLPVPQETVTGSITFSAESLGGAPIDSIISVSIKIDGHSYTKDEIGWSTEPLTSSYSFGGTLNTINNCNYGTNDILLSTINNFSNWTMTYTSSGVFDGWSTTNVNGTFSAVPVLAPMVLAPILLLLQD